MKFYKHRITALKSVLASYNPPNPFHLHLKDFFKKNKQFGSRDRRELKLLCYAHWRIGYLIKAQTDEERIALAMFVLDPVLNDWAFEHIDAKKSSELRNWADLDLAERVRSLQEFDWFESGQFLKWDSHISPMLNTADISESYFQKSNLWLRVFENIDGVKKNIEKLYPSEQFGECSLAIANGSNLDRLPVEILENIEVQDISSQRAIEKINLADKAELLDCCSGSGGKSISLWKRNNSIALFECDVRSSILDSLKSRFKENGITDYHIAEIDMTSTNGPLTFEHINTNKTNTKENWDIVLCDVPCSGSGTWSRTPEHRKYFKTKHLDKFVESQKKILTKASYFLKPGGSLWYMTCSVFAKENESLVAAFLDQNQNFELSQQGYENWLNKGGDCIYFAEIKHKAE